MLKSPTGMYSSDVAGCCDGWAWVLCWVGALHSHLQVLCCMLHSHLGSWVLAVVEYGIV
jgi:hypothetical protein